jgi:class 3 adenylate cyclase
MAPLTTKARARLPDSAFAYIDSQRKRRLPINDESHVRNALARFNQTRFEDPAARDRARNRLLRAAKKYGIVPIGFMSGQLRSAGQVPPRRLPAGIVTFLLADVEDSTGLVRKLGDRYGGFLTDLRTLLRSAIEAAGGCEVDARADELFAVFETAAAAVQAAVGIQRDVQTQEWPDGIECKLRIGLHTGAATPSDGGYVGLVVHTAARICALAVGGEVLTSTAVRDAMSDGGLVGFTDLGPRQLRGLPAAESLYRLVF